MSVLLDIKAQIENGTPPTWDDNILTSAIQQEFQQSAKERYDYVKEHLDERFDYWRQIVKNYRQKFNYDVTKYAMDHNLLRAMKDALDIKVTNNVSGLKDIVSTPQVHTGGKHGSQPIYLRAKVVKNSKNKTIATLIDTMQMGHQLLLQMREEFTGQEIQTIITILFEGNVYQLAESTLRDYLRPVLSRYGGSTYSNPFSVAFELNIEDIQDRLRQEQAIGSIAEEGTPTSLIGLIFQAKQPYLEAKAQEKYGKTQKEVYPNIYWDAKDAEILKQLQYELKAQNTEDIFQLDFNPNRYALMRASMGGGGGYATPFFKGGDVALIQVKSFKFDRKKIAAANFARFSLLRNRFAELELILNSSNASAIIQQLAQFFTEEDNKISEQIQSSTLPVNEAARQAILGLLQDLT